jgi:uncharacterized RDD family membrane protein YckC
MSDPNFSEYPSASLFRQMAAMLYDSMLILAVLFFASAIAVAFHHGEAIESSILFKLYLLLVAFTYYAWFWQKSGQTLGMRAWKIRIVDADGVNPGWATCYLRLCCALLSWSCLGLGYLWRLFKPWTWHDRLSGTRIIRLSALQERGQEASPSVTGLPAENEEKSEAEK